MDSIVKIPIDQLYPHPDNPRKNLGDLSELAESIRAKGIMQNLTVIRGRRGTDEEIAQIVKLTATLSDDNKIERDAKAELQQQIENRWVATDYTIIIGHRRHAAAKLAGLTELPCVIVDMDPREQMQTMLIENMQRSDLTKFEEAQGFQMMLDLGTPVEEIAEKTGFSETTVRRRLKWMELDPAKFKKATENHQISLGDLDRLSQIEDLNSRNECLDKIGTNDFDLAVQKAIQKQEVARNLPKVKEWLKKIHAKKMKDSERWSSSYDQIGGTLYLERWGEPGNLPKEGIAEEPVFYWLGSNSYEFNQLRLYHEHKKAPPVKRSPEEIEKHKAVQAAWGKIESTASDAHNLRKKFIEDFNVTEKNNSRVLYGAVLAGCYNALSYSSSDRTTLYRLAGITDTGYIPDREEKFCSVIDKIPANDGAKLVYAVFGDNPISCAWGNRSSFPGFQRNWKLELIYRWLSMLGYKMSTEEARLLKEDSGLYGDPELYGMGEEDGEV